MRTLAVLVAVVLAEPSVAYLLWRFPFKLAPVRDVSRPTYFGGPCLTAKRSSAHLTARRLSEPGSASALREAISLKEDGLITDEVHSFILFVLSCGSNPVQGL